MQEAKTGDYVSVHYTGKLEDGTVFDSSVGREPFKFLLGEGYAILGFERAVKGMKVGETKTDTFDPDWAYGPYDPAGLIQIERSRIPVDGELKVGQHLHLTHPDGRSMQLTITEVTDESVTLDSNHPLAGKTLTFEIQLLDIEVNQDTN